MHSVCQPSRARCGSRSLSVAAPNGARRPTPSTATAPRPGQTSARVRPHKQPHHNVITGDITEREVACVFAEGARWPESFLQQRQGSPDIEANRIAFQVNFCQKRWIVY